MENNRIFSGKPFLPALLCVSLAAILFTACIVDLSLWQGITTGKYFWFAATISIAILLWLPFRHNWELRITDLAALLLVVYICFNYGLYHNQPSMHWWLFLLMIPLYVLVRTVCHDARRKQWLVNGILIIILTEAVWGLLQLYGFTRSYHGLYKITGSLSNPGPYSGFIAIGIPLVLNNVLNKQLRKWEQWLGIVTLIAAGLVLPATMSRAAWLAAIAGSIPVLWQQFPMNHWPNWLNKRNIRIAAITVLSVMAMGTLAGLYLLKKDSADGRWLIWQVSAQMIKEHPLTGVGYGRFTATYGDAQAAYFLSGKGTNAQVMVADSPEYAFNEYIQMAVELGFTGLLLFIAMIASCGWRNISLLLAFLVFSAFSYPFGVLPVSILFVFLLAMSASSSRRLQFPLSRWLRVAGIALCLCITGYGAYQVLSRYPAYKDWQKSQTLYQSGLYTEAINDYKELYTRLKYQKQFLFEYGQCLSKSGQYLESNLIFQQFLYYGSDPMIYNCMGNNNKAMGYYEKAEAEYIHASQIVPNRHYPLYLLMKLYQETGQAGKARAMATDLLRKPVKIPSPAIQDMEEEAKNVMRLEK